MKKTNGGKTMTIKLWYSETLQYWLVSTQEDDNLPKVEVFKTRAQARARKAELEPSKLAKIHIPFIADKFRRIRKALRDRANEAA